MPIHSMLGGYVRKTFLMIALFALFLAGGCLVATTGRVSFSENPEGAGRHDVVVVDWRRGVILGAEQKWGLGIMLLAFGFTFGIAAESLKRDK